MPVETIPRGEVRGPATTMGGHLVIVYNNDHNTFDEVIDILQRATDCSLDEARMETWEIHNLGKSIVHHGDEAECERAASVIRTIGLTVEVRQL